MNRRKLVSLIFFTCLSIYVTNSLLAFRPPEIRVTEDQARQIAIEHYHKVYGSKYNFTNVQILRAELQDAEPRNPWAPRPKWYIRVKAIAIIDGEQYNICLDIEINAESGKVLRSIALP